MAHPSDMTELEISVRAVDAALLVTLAGELDMATKPVLEGCLRYFEGHVRVDCARLSFLDSSGLNLFVATHHRLAENDGRFVLANVVPSCRRPIEIMRLDDVFELDG